MMDGWIVRRTRVRDGRTTRVTRRRDATRRERSNERTNERTREGRPKDDQRNDRPNDRARIEAARVSSSSSSIRARDRTSREREDVV